MQKSYAWLPEHNEQIHHNFVSRVTQRVKDLIHHACAKRKKRPVWIKESIWEQLCARRSTVEFSQLSEKMKKNRASTSSQFGSSLHCGGSVSALEHAKRLVIFVNFNNLITYIYNLISFTLFYIKEKRIRTRAYCARDISSNASKKRWKLGGQEI